MGPAVGMHFHLGVTAICSGSFQRPERGSWGQNRVARTCPIWSRLSGLSTSHESHRLLMPNVPWCPPMSSRVGGARVAIKSAPLHPTSLQSPRCPDRKRRWGLGGLPPAGHQEPGPPASPRLCARPGCRLGSPGKHPRAAYCSPAKETRV